MKNGEEEDVMLDISDEDVLDPQIFEVEVEGGDDYFIMNGSIKYDLLMVQSQEAAATINLIEDSSCVDKYLVHGQPDVGLVLLEIFKKIKETVPDSDAVFEKIGVKIDYYEN